MGWLPARRVHLFYQLDCLQPIPGHAGGVAECFYHLNKHVAIVVVVFYDQHLQRRGVISGHFGRSAPLLIGVMSYPISVMTYLISVLSYSCTSLVR